MDIIHQYYNEIVLAFSNYDTDFKENIIIIYVPDDSKPFEIVCEKIDYQLQKIAELLDTRDKDIHIKIQRNNAFKDLILVKA